MKPIKTTVKILSASIFFACGINSICAYANESKPRDSVPPPKLVLVLVVDGLPQEQVQRYRDQLGEGGFKRLMQQGAWYGNAHQAHGVTVTAVGHAAVLTGAYPYQHGIIANNWIDPKNLASVYCTEDVNHTYLGEETKPSDGTSPANLKVNTLGDELRYASGNRSKVIAVSGKDRGAILLAGKTGTAYMLMKKSGNFASSSYYMNSYPAWQKTFQAKRPQDQYYGKQWTLSLPESAYFGDAKDELVAPSGGNNGLHFPYTYDSKSGQPDAEYYDKLFTSPFLDKLTLDFALAALDGEKLGQNSVTDLLAVSLSSHDYVNHAWGPESRMSHDHLQRLDRLIASFLNDVDKKIGLDKTLVILTADHGFANVPEFSQENKLDAYRLDSSKMMTALNLHLQEKFGLEKLAKKWSSPHVLLDYENSAAKGIARADLENTAARFLLSYPGVANTYTRSQFETGALADNRISKLMQRAWHRQLSGDVAVVTKPFWYFSSGLTGTSHGSPYNYDSNVPLMFMGKPWIKAGSRGEYAEVVDIASTLANILRIRPPAAAEGRVLVEMLK
ncbi:MAG: alkaline phosphatase family protein [Undibacterium sp.]|nr:alkaline phosphatase family protein [Undibacterium sp.]